MSGKAKFCLGAVSGGIFTLLLLGGGLFWFSAWLQDKTFVVPRPIILEGLPDLQLKAVDTEKISNRFSLKEIGRDQIVFLNVWATWCALCVKELPEIEGLYERFKGRGVTFILISSESLTTVQDFLNKNSMRQYQSLPFFVTDGEELPEILKTPGVPATFIFSRDGRKVYEHIGASKWNDERFAQSLEQLIAQTN